jgi:hypothetical protein
MPALSGVAPDQMGAVVLNVTAAGGTGVGTLTVHRPGSGLGEASSLSYARGATVANRAVTALSDGGKLRLDNRGGTADVVVDVVGWFAPTLIAGGKVYQAVSPRRVLDTRTGIGARRASLGAGKTISVVLRGKGKALPSNASAVVMNLTSTLSTRTTALTAWPNGVRRPVVPDFSVVKGRATGNLVVVRLGKQGKLNLYNRSGSTYLTGDVVGYYR